MNCIFMNYSSLSHCLEANERRVDIFLNTWSPTLPVVSCYDELINVEASPVIQTYPHRSCPLNHELFITISYLYISIVTLDLTPPVSGYIYDGNDEDSVDVKYSSESACVAAFWGNFSDPESNIENYIVSVHRRKRYWFWFKMRYTKYLSFMLSSIIITDIYFCTIFPDMISTLFSLLMMLLFSAWM